MCRPIQLWGSWSAKFATTSDSFNITKRSTDGEHLPGCASGCALLLVLVMSFIRLIVCRRILAFILLLLAGVQPLGSVPITAPTVATSSESAITGTLTTVTAASSSSSSIVILHEYLTNGKCEGLPFRQIALTLGDCYEHHMEPDPFSIVKGTLFYAHRVSWLSPNNGLLRSRHRDQREIKAPTHMREGQADQGH